ncbi:hypothetical protein [Desulfogranum mediterraneum]|uniref:hypothetical protein n=1 Tax=Desulfogranum mediterraneum TaxID=160661 RepID=UPI000411F194|nr:hypothetical protein [Desulfogranum mediterraneum]
MDQLKWRSSYETGIREMDEQDQHLFSLINTMYRVIRRKEEPPPGPVPVLGFRP